VWGALLGLEGKRKYEAAFFLFNKFPQAAPENTLKEIILDPVFLRALLNSNSEGKLRGVVRNIIYHILIREEWDTLTKFGKLLLHCGLDCESFVGVLRSLLRGQLLSSSQPEDPAHLGVRFPRDYFNKERAKRLLNSGWRGYLLGTSPFDVYPILILATRHFTQKREMALALKLCKPHLGTKSFSNMRDEYIRLNQNKTLGRIYGLKKTLHEILLESQI
jgi:hypothetical protein